MQKIYLSNIQMLERKDKRIGMHILFWMLFVIYDTINASWGENDFFDFSQIHKVWIAIPFFVAIVYFNLYVLMPRLLYPKKYGLYAASLLGTVLVWALTLRFVGYYFFTSWDLARNNYEYPAGPDHYFVPIRIARNAFRLYPILALTMLIKVLRNSYNNEKQLRASELARHNAELSYLRLQIHPHFFFNTLSSLYSLTLKKSDLASDIVLRMSGLMHYMLYEIGAEPVLLEEEINQLKNYIAIEELRFGDRLEYSFQHSGDITDKSISPLLLLPFVENAFKHSLRNELKKAWVTIDMKVTENIFFMVIENSMSTAEKSKPGIGLANVKKRLDISYRNKHELIIKSEDNIFRISLKLQLDEKN